MNAKNTLSITEGRKRIFDIAEEVQKPGKHYTFTENGKPKVVLMSADEFESLVEDLEILNNPRVMANIKKSEDEYKRGEYITWGEMKKELAEKTKKKYSANKKEK